MAETKQEIAASPAHEEPTVAEKMALIERILASSHFRRATRLREFLLFVGQRSVENGVRAIHEQEIGSAVFERPVVYDTSMDNIVRVNATELRKRLDLYFTSEGARETFIVEMRRGSYTLQFRPRTVAPDESQPAPQPSPLLSPDPVVFDHAIPSVVAESGQTKPEPRTLAWRAASLVLLLLCGLLAWHDLRLQRDLNPWKSGPALRAFWSGFLESGQQVDIILADTSFALAEDIEGRSVPLPSYLNYDYKRVDNLPGLSRDKREDAQSALNRNNGSVGDFIVAQRILSLQHTASPLRLQFAREYTSEAIKTNSVVLIGSRQSNPWVELFSGHMNFSMEYDPVHHQSSVLNRQPRPGEDPVYVRSGDKSRNEGLSVIAFMPNLSHTGSALIIEGTDSQATRAAGEFITSDASLVAFLERLHDTSFPYFEILLEDSQLTGTPLHSQILAYRLYPRSGNNATPEVGAAGEKER